MSVAWGDGTDSSSDGQYFRADGRTGPGGDVNAKYGIDPGVVLYTIQPGQYGTLHTQVISATASDALYVLDGLHPQAHRIQDLKERKLYAVEKPDTYPVLKLLIGEPVDTAALVRGWGDLMRVRRSIEADAVAPSTILR